jgi:hypothetical protein
MEVTIMAGLFAKRDMYIDTCQSFVILMNNFTAWPAILRQTQNDMGRMSPEPGEGREDNSNEKF